MGQQQLLLLVLAAVIVGTAIVLGVNLFQENAAQANSDAVVQDCVAIAHKAYAYWKKPLALGGAGGDVQTNAITFAKIGADANSPNASAPYTIAATAANKIEINGTGTEDLNEDGTKLTVKIEGDFSGNTPKFTTTVTP